MTKIKTRKKGQGRKPLYNGSEALLIQARLPANLVRRFRHAAKRNGISTREVILHAFKSYLRTWE